MCHFLIELVGSGGKVPLDGRTVVVGSYLGLVRGEGTVITLLSMSVHLAAPCRTGAADAEGSGRPEGDERTTPIA
jgi:hypothetical protein